jgi:hypothetical protein
LLYLVIGIMIVAVVGAFFRQRPHGEETGSERTGADESPRFDDVLKKNETETVDVLSFSSVKETALKEATFKEAALKEATLQAPPEGRAEPLPPLPQLPAEPAPADSFGEALKPVLTADPISSPGALAGATYSSVVPSSSPYAFGSSAEEEKPKPQSSLLRWSGKTGSIQVGAMIVRGPVAYWSDGPSSTPEPSCVDVSLPIELPESGAPSDGAASYGEMTPLQRGTYLMWLASGRIQTPPHPCYAALWLFGLERRVLIDRLDIGLCIGEAFRLLPLIRWDSLRQSLIKLITWMAAKVWLPEDQLLAFTRSLLEIPTEILCMLLKPYADAKLPLPSFIAYTVMRTAPFGGEAPMAHSVEMMDKFAPDYKSTCAGGIVLTKPRTSLFVAYVPSNPSLTNEKKAAGGVLELPDFFKDTTDFAPLIAAWDGFLKLHRAVPQPASALKELEKRPDWDSFVRELRGAEEAGGAGTKPVPVSTGLENLAELMGIELKADRNAEKTGAADRKKIVEAARVEGFLILPDLGVAGKEYRWNDPVVLVPFPAGSRPSRDFSASALLLEYAAALTGRSDEEFLTLLRDRLDSYFPLSPDDKTRLEALSALLTLAGERREEAGKKEEEKEKAKEKDGQEK